MKIIDIETVRRHPAYRHLFNEENENHYEVKKTKLNNKDYGNTFGQ